MRIIALQRLERSTGSKPVISSRFTVTFWKSGNALPARRAQTWNTVFNSLISCQIHRAVDLTRTFIRRNCFHILKFLIYSGRTYSGRLPRVKLQKRFETCKFFDHFFAKIYIPIIYIAAPVDRAAADCSKSRISCNVLIHRKYNKILSSGRLV